MNSKNYEESGYGLGLDLRTTLCYATRRVSYPRRSEVGNHLRPI